MNSLKQGIVNVIYEIRTNAFKKETKTDFANCNVKIKLILGNKEKKKICWFDWLVGFSKSSSAPRLPRLASENCGSQLVTL